MNTKEVMNNAVELVNELPLKPFWKKQISSLIQTLIQEVERLQNQLKEGEYEKTKTK